MQDQNTEGELDFTALARELELDKLPREEQEEVFADVLDALNLRVFKRILDAMPAEQKEHIKTIGQVNPENMYAAVLNTVPKDKQFEMFQAEIEVIKENMKAKMAKENGA